MLVNRKKAAAIKKAIKSAEATCEFRCPKDERVARCVKRRCKLRRKDPVDPAAQDGLRLRNNFLTRIWTLRPRLSFAKHHLTRLMVIEQRLKGGNAPTESDFQFVQNLEQQFPPKVKPKRKRKRRIKHKRTVKKSK